jgi:hypothetical protein
MYYFKKVITSKQTFFEEKKIIFCGHWPSCQPLTKKAGSGSGAGSGPQHW